MLEIKPFMPTDLDVVTGMAREQDFAPGVGDIEIYANTDRQGIWLAEDPVVASLLLNDAIDRKKGIVLIDTPGYTYTRLSKRSQQRRASDPWVRPWGCTRV